MKIETQSEKQQLRKLMVYSGWIRRLKYQMLADFAENRTVTVNSDQMMRMDAANSLIDTGMAVEVSRREIRTRCGPLPESGRRRMRTVLTIAKPVHQVDDEARI